MRYFYFKCLPILILLISHTTSAAEFRLGVDVFLEGYTQLVENHRVGLITNQTGKNSDGQTTIDLLYSHPMVNLVALFAPEHGIRGIQVAGEKVVEATDKITGLPIYSLYGGGDHRPSRVALDNIDTLIYDIQDVGSRAYTYIWSMAEAMAAAGEYNKTFIVLDRPNPLSCRQIDGPLTDDNWLSFLGLYPIPRVYGMTVGELARYFNREHDLGCRLVVIPMASYQRKKSWEETGLTWVAPSPNIPSTESAVCFAATGTIGVLGVIHIGIGTAYPFQFIGAPWLDNKHATDYLNQCNLSGVTFEPYSFKSTSGMFRGKVVNAVKLRVFSPSEFLPARTEVYILDYLQHYYKKDFTWKLDRFDSFDKATGTSSVRNQLLGAVRANVIVQNWDSDLRMFEAKKKRYLIYQ